MKLITCIFCILIFQGCSSFIPKSIKLPENNALISYLDVKKNAYNFEGKVVRWGGEITKVVNLKDRTMIEVVNLPLSAYAKPKKENESQGRFKLYYDGLLDPVIYQEGKMLTVVGTVKGIEEGKIGEHEYLYPVVKAQSVHLWKEVRKITMGIKEDPFYFHSYWGHYNRRHFLRPWYF